MLLNTENLPITEDLRYSTDTTEVFSGGWDKEFGINSVKNLFEIPIFFGSI